MRILIVEDEPNDAELLSLIVEHAGYQPVVAQNGQEALEKAADIDLILMDLVMPVMDGLSAIRKLRETKETAAIPIIGVTALPLPREEIIRNGADDAVIKPFTCRKISEAIAKRIPAVPATPHSDRAE